MTKLSVPAHLRDRPSRLILPHFHKRHEMVLSPDDGVRFECDGCRQPGAGLRYHCAEGCDVDLHVACALAPPRREIAGHSFEFRPKPEGRRYCDACGGPARGFVYHCRELDQDVHPCCADLPERFEVAGLSFERRVTERPPSRCVLCADDKVECPLCLRRALWSYRFDDAGDGGGGGGGAVFLHLPCAKHLASSGGATIVTESVGQAYSLKRKKLQPSESGDAARRRTGTTNRSSKEKELVPVPANTATGHSSTKEIVPVSAEDLRALLRQGRGARPRGRGKLKRSLMVLGFMIRVVIGVLFGDPTAMVVALAGVVFPNR